MIRTYEQPLMRSSLSGFGQESEQAEETELLDPWAEPTAEELPKEPWYKTFYTEHKTAVLIGAGVLALGVGYFVFYKKGSLGFLEDCDCGE